MNKEEVINKINEMTVETFFSKTLFVQQKKVIELIEQLDEPEKVKIPQFVAEIIEYYKGQNATLYDVLREKNFNKQYSEWLLNEQNAYDKVARAWLDGYEVEKEKRYVVTDGTHLYFKEYQEDVEIVILADEMPGTMDYVKKFDTKEQAREVANILGWKVKEVEE